VSQHLHAEMVPGCYRCELAADEWLPRRGDRVRIPKGARITTTHPAGDRIAKRSQVVRVAQVFPAYPGRPAEVSWAGTGGYWCNATEWEATE
jgi:hypothetical protein